MKESDRPFEQIEEIRSIMARSTTFVSLSGLSGVAAGILGAAGAFLIYRTLGTVWLSDDVIVSLRNSPDLVRSVASVFLGTLVAALVAAFLFTVIRARRHRHGLWDLASRRFAIHLALPLIAGGVFVLALKQYGVYELICPAMLTFFGLALINAGKYSFSEAVIFGVIELVLGLAAVLWVEAGLLLWAVGFGIVTAGYGIIMYLQHER